MANEGRLQISLTATKANLKFSKNETIQFDIATGRYGGGVRNISTSYEAITLTDISTAGVTYFRNLDATNYVEIGVEVSSAFYGLIKLKPGEIGCARLSTTSIFGRANTGAVDVEIICLSD